MTKTFISRGFVTVTLGLLTAGPLLAASPDNWPQWRGPLATGVSPTANPPTSWSETNNVKWKVKIPGRGTSTPIIWSDMVFIQTAISTGKKPEAGAEAEPPQRPEGDRRRGPGGRGGGGGGRSQKPTETHEFTLMALERGTGKTRWQKVARAELPHEGHHQDHGFASASPVTDGDHVIGFFGSRGLHCYDLKGDLKWQKDLGRMQTKNSFGEGSSPALHGKVVVVNWDHEGEDFIAAFDKNSGKELWREKRDEDTSWATPLVVEHQGKAQVITAATKKIRSYDLATGKLLWEGTGLTANVIPTPVAGDGVAYITSGFRGNALFAIRLGAASGDVTETDAVIWKHNKSTPYVPSPMLYGDKLYFFGGNNAMLSCFDAKTGKPLIDAERVEGLQGVYASPIGAGGRVYLIGRNGVSAVIKNADKLEILSVNKLDDKIDASPATAGKELFLRGHEHLYCLAEK